MKAQLTAMGERFLLDEGFRKEVLDNKDSVIGTMKIIAEMTEDYLTGTYTEVPRTVMTVIVGAVSVMVLPDPLGPLDEIAIGLLLAKEFSVDIENYKNWKLNQPADIASVAVNMNGKTYVVKGEDLTDFTRERLKEGAYESISGVGSRKG